MEILITHQASFLLTVEYDKQLKETKENRASMEERLRDVLDALRNEEAIKMLNGEKAVALKKITEGIEMDDKILDVLLNYAKLLYDSGEYEGITHINL
jgi:hypothetical protein